MAPKLARVLYDFEPAEEGEIAVRAGDVVFVSSMARLTVVLLIAVGRGRLVDGPCGTGAGGESNFDCCDGRRHPHPTHVHIPTLMQMLF